MQGDHNPEMNLIPSSEPGDRLADEFLEFLVDFARAKEEDVFLGAEVAEESAGRRPRDLGYLLDGGRLEALLPEQFDGSRGQRDSRAVLVVFPTVVRLHEARLYLRTRDRPGSLLTPTVQ